MLKRMILMLVVVLAVLGGLGFFKYKQIQAAIAMGASFAPPPSAVTTLVARQETWPSSLKIIGSTAAIQGVTGSADLPGTVAKINFAPDQSVHAGQGLGELHPRQDPAQIASPCPDQELGTITC